MAWVDLAPIPGEGAGGRARIERLLARYPALSDGELGELLRWFECEASAFDVALAARNPQVGRGIERFKAEHIDRPGFKDVIRAIAFLAAFGAAMLGVAWLAD